jgi:lysyl-tRNA synthetase class 1
MNMSNKNQNPRRLQAAGSDQHWSAIAAQRVVDTFAEQSVFTCAAGISPSGVVHFGNFRDVMTSLMVVNALRQLGKNARFIFSWDDFDRFRKVPKGVDDSFKQHIGKPLSAVPDPLGELPSYGRRFESQFEAAMRELGIELDYRYQTEQYKSGRYDDLILQALAHRRRIADVLLGFMSDKAKAAKSIDPDEYRASFYPVSVYSRFTGKDSTNVLSFDDESGLLTYVCKETGKTDSVDLTQDRIVKLAWKVDWPMRWSMEQVVFEPGGKDHAAPGSSYDVSSVIAKEIFHREAPLFVGYEFVGLPMVGKMSGSSGDAVSPGQLLEIYEPALLRWLYSRKTPDQAFSLAFDSEIFRQYDEFDREIAQRIAGSLPAVRQSSVDIGLNGHVPVANPMPFRQAVAFGQIVQWDAEKVGEMCEPLGMTYDPDSVAVRLAKARAWLETYNPEAMLRLNETANTAYVSTMSPQAVDYVRQLRAALVAGTAPTVAELEVLAYAIPKDETLDDKTNKVRQRAFFKDVYNLLVGTDTGPRLSTFLWAVDRERVLGLLDV